MIHPDEYDDFAGFPLAGVVLIAGAGALGLALAAAILKLYYWMGG